MSRKIGFGDTYFDPDIDGDIDFDFFGGGGGTSASSVPDSAVDGGAEAAAKVDQITANNNSYNSRGNYTINGNRKSQSEIKSGGGSENNGSEFERQQVPAFEIRNRSGVRKMEGGGEGEAEEEEEAIDDQDQRTKIDGYQLDNENFTANTHREMYTNRGDTENAEEGAETEPSADGQKLQVASQRNGQDDEDEPVFSECDDSASDLFSDEDSSDESEEDYLDSDITEVSPLSSANMSPLPESPRRTPDPRLKRQLLKNHSLSSSPKLGARRMKSETNGRLSAPPSNGSDRICSKNNAKGGSGASSRSGSESGHDTVDLNELTKAIRDLEEERKKNGSERSFKERQPSASYARPRKNMTFTNDEVRRIDHENKRLLRRIIDSQKSRRPQPHATHYGGRVASSAINRVKELRKIETENLVILKRLQAAKPTKELSREFLLGSSTPSSKGTSPSIPESKSSFSLTNATATAPPGSGARGRASRCHSTGSLNSSSLSGSWSGSGISTLSAVKGRSIRSTKGITAAAATNGTIAHER